MWKLESTKKLNGLLELNLISDEKMKNEYHLPLKTNHDHLIEVIGILSSKDEYITKITLICKKREKLNIAVL